ncbi:MAG: riboflavin synthase [Candidatus Hydrogenedentota bacterium]
MFTGLIQKTGRFHSKVLQKNNYRLKITIDNNWNDLQKGESIAVNGICLTLCEFSRNNIEFDVMQETMDKTALNYYTEGETINLERSLKTGERIGGHIVLGHIDKVGVINSIIDDVSGNRIRVGGIEEEMRYIIYKGSIAIDGISLTVSNVAESEFEVSIIPYTIENTNLRKKQIGDKVNIEFDYLTKIVERLLNKERGGLTEEKLKEYGF